LSLVALVLFAAFIHKIRVGVQESSHIHVLLILKLMLMLGTLAKQNNRHWILRALDHIGLTSYISIAITFFVDW
jgi:hypothetical protein